MAVDPFQRALATLDRMRARGVDEETIRAAEAAFAAAFPERSLDEVRRKPGTCRCGKPRRRGQWDCYACHARSTRRVRKGAPAIAPT